MVELRVTPRSRFPPNCYCQHHLLPAIKGVGLVQIAAIDTRLEQSAQGCSLTIGTKVFGICKDDRDKRYHEQGRFPNVLQHLRLATVLPWFKQFVQLFHCPFFPGWVSQYWFSLWAYKSLKVSLTITHICKHLLALLEMIL